MFPEEEILPQECNIESLPEFPAVRLPRKFQTFHPPQAHESQFLKINLNLCLSQNLHLCISLFSLPQSLCVCVRSSSLENN